MPPATSHRAYGSAGEAWPDGLLDRTLGLSSRMHLDAGREADCLHDDFVDAIRHRSEIERVEGTPASRATRGVGGTRRRRHRVSVHSTLAHSQHGRETFAARLPVAGDELGRLRSCAHGMRMCTSASRRSKRVACSLLTCLRMSATRRGARWKVCAKLMPSVVAGPPSSAIVACAPRTPFGATDARRSPC